MNNFLLEKIAHSEIFRDIDFPENIEKSREIFHGIIVDYFFWKLEKIERGVLKEKENRIRRGKIRKLEKVVERAHKYIEQSQHLPQGEKISVLQKLYDFETMKFLIK